MNSPHARRRNAPVPLAYCKSVGELQMPQRGDLGVLVLEPIEQRTGRIGGLVVNAPSESDGGVNDKALTYVLR